MYIRLFIGVFTHFCKDVYVMSLFALFVFGRIKKSTFFYFLLQTSEVTRTIP